MNVIVVNWKKFNGRKDVRNPSWFRVEYRLLEDPDFYNFSHEEFKAWLYVLAQACRKNSEVVSINFQHAKATARLTESAIKSAIRKLESLQLVRVSDTDTSRACHAPDTRQDSTVQDIQDIQDSTEYSSERSDDRFRAAVGFESLGEIFAERKVTTEIQSRWQEAFPDAPWVTSEIRKALAWEASNPTRRKKNFASFVTRWMTKGWDQRKTAPGADIDWNRIFAKEGTS